MEEAFPNEVGVISDLDELVFIMNGLSKSLERDFDRIVEDLVKLYVYRTIVPK